jgi:hypothetical protein
MGLLKWLFGGQSIENLVEEVGESKYNLDVREEERLSDIQRSRDNAKWTARQVIMRLARTQQYITADLVQVALVAAGYSLSDLGNAAGTMFKGVTDVYKVPGAYVKSKRAARRGGRVSVYESTEYQGIRIPIATFIKEYEG